MSSIHINQIKKYLFDNYTSHINTDDLINQKADALEAQKLTRALSAFILDTQFDISEVSACGTITDGGSDNGIDAIYIHEQTATIALTQSKWISSGIGEPKLDGALKFAKGVKDLINCKFENFNEKTNSRAEEIINALNNPRMKLVAYLIYTGKNDLAQPSRETLLAVQQEINDISDIISFKIINLKSIYDLLIEKTSGLPINTNIVLHHWGRIEEPSISYYGQISGEDIHRIWSDHGHMIFKKNIRHSLGETEVNNEIRKTIIGTPLDFWYFNNGITLIAKRIIKAPINSSSRDIGTFCCEDISIVNGAQTVSTIGKIDDSIKQNLSDIKVSARIISLEHRDESFGEKITKSNNLQNKIEIIDFISQDGIQLRIKQELALEGITYQLKRDSDFIPSKNSFSVIEATSALACKLADPALVALLKKDLNGILSDTEKSSYKKLFNPNISSHYLYNSVSAYRAALDENEKQKASNKSNPHTLTYLANGNYIFATIFICSIPNINFESTITDFQSELDKIDKVDLAKRCTIKLTDILLKDHRTASNLLSVFKTAEKCESILMQALDYKGGRPLHNQSEFELLSPQSPPQ